MPYKMLARKECLGIDYFFVLSKEKMCEILHKTKDGVAAHITSVDAGKIRMLLHYKMHLLDQDSYPDDGSFWLNSTNVTDYDIFATHPERICFWDFWDDNKDSLDSYQDPRPSRSETHEFTLNESYSSEISIATSTSTSSISREVTLDTHDELHSNSNCNSTSIYFEDSDTIITLKGIKRTLLLNTHPLMSQFTKIAY